MESQYSESVGTALVRAVGELCTYVWSKGKVRSEVSQGAFFQFVNGRGRAVNYHWAANVR